MAPKYETKKDSAYEEPPRPINPQGNDRVILSQIPHRQVAIIKLRLVCKTWKTGVDDYYQKLSDHYVMNHDYDSNYKYGPNHSSRLIIPRRNWSHEYFNSEDHTYQFLKHYQQTNMLKFSPGTPFISRRVIIGQLGITSEMRGNPVVGALRIFYRDVNKVLEMFGRNIWFVDIMICDQFPTTAVYYKKLRQWLILMPNLKALNVTYVINSNHPSPSELKYLQREDDEHPLPVLKQLKYLNTYKLPAPIFNEILRQNSASVSMLQLNKDKWQNEYDIFTASALPINLKQLSVRLGCDERFSMFTELSKKCKLEKLYLDYNFIMQAQNLSTVFGIATNWSDTLTNLMISLPYTGGMCKFTSQPDDLSGLLLFTPNVKRFKLILEGPTVIDFMLPLRDNLEIFGVGFIDKVVTELGMMVDLNRSCSRQVIQFVGYEGRLTESNIWQLFPKLNQIQIWDDYDRVKENFNKTWKVNRKTWSK